jgi:hypothetical protein
LRAGALRRSGKYVAREYVRAVRAFLENFSQEIKPWRLISGLFIVVDDFDMRDVRLRAELRCVIGELSED